MNTAAAIRSALSLVNTEGGQLTLRNKHGRAIRQGLAQAARKGLLSRTHGGEGYALNAYGREVLEA